MAIFSQSAHFVVVLMLGFHSPRNDVEHAGTGISVISQKNQIFTSRDGRTSYLTSTQVQPYRSCNSNFLHFKQFVKMRFQNYSILSSQTHCKSKCRVHKKCFSLQFPKNITCLSFGLLRFCHSCGVAGLPSSASPDGRQGKAHQIWWILGK